jgi:Phytanoyl-CoA dioxygenase (PhyH)
VDELADSSGLAGDPAALRQRLAADGYLFFRALLPADLARAAGLAVAARLRSGDWLDDRGLASARPRAVDVRDGLSDPAFRAAIIGKEFNRLPYLPPLRPLVRHVLGPAAFSYPAKVLRAVYPERPGVRSSGRYVHCDYIGAGVQDMLTSWVPLMDIPVELGGLAVRPGGHLGPPRLPLPLRPGARGWATTSYRPGDVIIFHCLTPHAALPNTGQALRLSADFRWQRPDQPVPADAVLGPSGRPPELFSRLLRRQRWWEPVPAGLDLRPRRQLAGAAPAPSRFFAVDRGWQSWRPRSADGVGRVR